MEGVRQFSNLTVRFNERFNFIVGPNGCGKTSVLAGISHCFTSNYEYSRFSEDAQFWCDFKHDTIKYRVGLGKNSLSGAGYRNSSIRGWNLPPPEDGRVAVGIYEVNRKISGFVPLFIGAQRSIKYRQVHGVNREDGLEESVNKYLTNATKSLYGEWQTDVKQWFINRYFVIDKEWAAEEKNNWDHLIQELPFIAPFDSNFKYVRTERDLEPIFSIYGKECYLEEVSSGFQAVLLIIANIIEWIEGSRSPGNRLVQDATGTVLIDELDIHLHPEWQFTIRAGLSKIFPKLQFIVTTHSPHLLASASANEVIVMPGRASDLVVSELSPTNRSYSGWSTDQILSEIMGVRSLDNKDYEKLVAAAMNCIDAKDAAGLKLAIERLQKVCHPNDTMLIVFTARLAALEAVAND